MNLLELCRQNRDLLSSRFENLLNSADDDARPLLLAFAEAVKENGRIGANMRAMVLLDFLETDRWLNIHQWAVKISTRGGKPVEEILREKLKHYYDRRMAFDGFFESGFGFRYGALNIGGLGAQRFGEYCAVLRKETHAQCGVGYLSGDSLNHYMTWGVKINQHKLQSECANEAAKHMLLTLKHASELTGKPPLQWPGLVCNADCYAEAIIVEGGVTATDLSCVRIGKLDFDLYFEYAFLEFGERLSELDRHRVDCFATIDDRLRALGISWETV